MGLAVCKQSIWSCWYSIFFSRCFPMHQILGARLDLLQCTSFVRVQKIAINLTSYCFSHPHLNPHLHSPNLQYQCHPGNEEMCQILETFHSTEMKKLPFAKSPLTSYLRNIADDILQMQRWVYHLCNRKCSQNSKLYLLTR